MSTLTIPPKRHLVRLPPLPSKANLYHNFDFYPSSIPENHKFNYLPLASWIIKSIVLLCWAIIVL